MPYVLWSNQLLLGMNPGLSPRQGGSQAETLLFAGRRNGSPEGYNLPVMHRSWHCLSPMWLSLGSRGPIAWGASGIRFPKHPSIGVWASIFPPLSGILPRKRGPRIVGVAPSFSPALRFSGRRECKPGRADRAPRKSSSKGSLSTLDPQLRWCSPRAHELRFSNRPRDATRE